MTVVLLFFLCFVAGPLIFWALVRPVPTRRSLWGIGSFVASLAVAGVVLRYGMAVQWGQSVEVGAISILLMWLAWLGALAFGTQAVRCADKGRAVRHWSGVIGALGTTVPWFGLASARMMQV